MSDNDRGGAGDEEREAQAGEYVIGTMPTEEREAFERALERDPALLAMVRAWEERLADLVAMVPEQAPDPRAWSALERALERMTDRRVASPAVEFLSPTAMAGALAPLKRSRARWRAAAAVTTALAASLALFVASPTLRDWASPALGTWASTTTRGQGASYLAVVNRGGELPALVVEVDTGTGIVHVRALATETPADRSLELWYISPVGGAPRSLGLVEQPRRDAPIPAVAKSGNLAGATLAVSVEPRGGSKTGGPSGPVIYSGKLLAQ